MKKVFVLFALVVWSFMSFGRAHAAGDMIVGTKYVPQTMGQEASNDFCGKKFPADETMRRVCFVAYSGSVVSNGEGGYKLNVVQQKEVIDDEHRISGTVLVQRCDVVYRGDKFVNECTHAPSGYAPINKVFQ